MSPEAIALAKDFITKEEGCELTRYLDTAHKWTIGVGHLIKDDESYDVISYDEAMQLLEDDLKTAIQAVDELVTVPLHDNEAAALVDFVFNCGVTAFKTSTLLRKINSNNILDASNEFGKWVHAGGVVDRGLINRRAAERRLFITGSME